MSKGTEWGNPKQLAVLLRLCFNPTLKDQSILKLQSIIPNMNPSCIATRYVLTNKDGNIQSVEVYTEGDQETFYLKDLLLKIDNDELIEKHKTFCKEITDNYKAEDNDDLFMEMLIEGDDIIGIMAFLGQGIDLNITNWNGNTALHFAAEKGMWSLSGFFSKMEQMLMSKT